MYQQPCCLLYSSAFVGLGSGDRCTQSRVFLFPFPCRSKPDVRPLVQRCLIVVYGYLGHIHSSPGFMWPQLTGQACLERLLFSDSKSTRQKSWWLYLLESAQWAHSELLHVIVERSPKGQASDSGRSGVSPKVGRSKNKERPRFEFGAKDRKRLSIQGICVTNPLYLGF